MRDGKELAFVLKGGFSQYLRSSKRVFEIFRHDGKKASEHRVNSQILFEVMLPPRSTRSTRSSISGGPFLLAIA